MPPIKLYFFIIYASFRLWTLLRNFNKGKEKKKITEKSVFLFFNRVLSANNTMKTLNYRLMNLLFFLMRFLSLFRLLLPKLTTTRTYFFIVQIQTTNFIPY